ncbi:MAG TPA: YkuS family protein [Bacillota bacterium]|jgi:arginine repressor|nr:YkuS family protein [Peptococcaceae bacterium MAG4]NLW38733.1 YkuS family protein [Peptococcaceae bacterium]HPZ44166.1 YkuS family protein [Bacillota bacterium]HQD76652.1 YkuS family protein [Bacillota bacterium]HUM59428.1 YkuS family protein [Bacillota bacterium]
MKKIIAVEEGLSQIRSALEEEGYVVVKPGTSQRIDATVITGMSENIMGMQDTTDKSMVIDASGKTADEVLNDLKRRFRQLS